MTTKSAGTFDALVLSEARNSAQSKTSAFARILARCENAYAIYGRERAIQKTIRELEGLDDNTLRDIGVRRMNIEHAVRSRFAAQSRTS